MPDLNSNFFKCWTYVELMLNLGLTNIELTLN